MKGSASTLFTACRRLPTQKFAMTFDKIGMWMGENISEMNRDRILEFAAWAGKRIEKLEGIERETADFRIDKEIKGMNHLRGPAAD